MPRQRASFNCAPHAKSRCVGVNSDWTQCTIKATYSGFCPAHENQGRWLNAPHISTELWVDHALDNLCCGLIKGDAALCRKRIARANGPFGFCYLHIAQSPPAWKLPGAQDTVQLVDGLHDQLRNKLVSFVRGKVRWESAQKYHREEARRHAEDEARARRAYAEKEAKHQRAQEAKYQRAQEEETRRAQEEETRRAQDEKARRDKQRQERKQQQHQSEQDNWYQQWYEQSQGRGSYSRQREEGHRQYSSFTRNSSTPFSSFTDVPQWTTAQIIEDFQDRLEKHSQIKKWHQGNPASFNVIPWPVLHHPSLLRPSQVTRRAVIKFCKAKHWTREWKKYLEKVRNEFHDQRFVSIRQITQSILDVDERESVEVCQRVVIRALNQFLEGVES